MVLFACKADVFAQTGGCWRSIQAGTVTFTQKRFDSLVTSYINKVNASKKMDTADYIMMIKLANSIFFNRYGSIKEGCWPEPANLYQKFNIISSGKFFYDQLEKFLGTCVPNRGMGCYFVKYDLDWGGAHPNDNSLIRVVAN